MRDGSQTNPSAALFQQYMVATCSPILQLVHMCTPTPVPLRRASCFLKGFSVGDKVSSWNSKGFKQNNKSPHTWPSPHPLSGAHWGPKSLTMTRGYAWGMGNDSELTQDRLAGVSGHSDQSSARATQTHRLWGLNTRLQILARNREEWGPRWRAC